MRAEPETKQCRVCKKELPIEEFRVRNKTTGSRRSHCNTCQRAFARASHVKHRVERLAKIHQHNKAKAADNIRRVNEYKEARPCTDCGKSYPHYVLDFDHRDPTSKSFQISTYKNKPLSWESLLKEINKCDVVCANCHRTRTFMRGQENAAR